ncbi:MAG: cytochrome b/b6 domain-containing protein [Pseudomonadota bacterium]
MNIMNRIRIYHAALAMLAVLAYLTGGIGLIHVWLGYGLAAIILLRLLWGALGKERQIGLRRFYPSFGGLDAGNILTHPAISKTLILGIALSLIMTAFTGIAMDKGKALGLAGIEMVGTAHADDDDWMEQSENGEEGGLMAETHELFANLLLLLAGMHVTYLLLFKRPLARFMLFVPKPSVKDGASE